MRTIVEIRATDPLMPAVFALQHEVFVVEQVVPTELEVDEDDKFAAHLVALSDGHVIGTLRIMRHARMAKIGRMAVPASSRRNGIGRGLMEFRPRRCRGNYSRLATYGTHTNGLGMCRKEPFLMMQAYRT